MRNNPKFYQDVEPLKEGLVTAKKNNKIEKRKL